MISQRKGKAKRQRQQEEVPNWSELCPDLLRYICKTLSFTDYNRAKSVCSSWHSALRDCFPEPNQNPWLILFPSYNLSKKINNNSSSCVLFIPDAKDNVYKTRDLGVDFIENRCLATYGSWLLMLNRLSNNLYILNPLTGERIDLPNTKRKVSNLGRACLWIDNKAKEYLVVLMMMDSSVFTKKGDNKWHEFSRFKWTYHKRIVYSHKDQKLYVDTPDYPVKIWDFSGDIPRENGFLDCFRPDPYKYLWCEIKTRLAVTVSGDVLMVSCCIVEDYNKTWRFRIYKANQVNRKWVEIDSLGDEALIFDMGVTVEAKDVQGIIKRNSIYFSGMDYERNNLDKIFVFDLTTQSVQSLPPCVSTSIQFSDARWFFPDFSG